MTRYAWLAVAALGGLLGCGSSGPSLAPVSGRISMRDAAMPDVLITFRPVGNTPGSGALGGADAEGRFEMADVRGAAGVHPGDYAIHLYPAPPTKGAGQPTDVVSAGDRRIPAIYVDPQTTPLKATIPAAGCHLEIALTPDGKNARVDVREPESLPATP